MLFETDKLITSYFIKIILFDIIHFLLLRQEISEKLENIFKSSQRDKTRIY